MTKNELANGSALITYVLLHSPETQKASIQTLCVVLRNAVHAWLDSKLPIEEFLWVEGVEVDKIKQNHGISTLEQILEGC